MLSRFYPSCPSYKSNFVSRNMIIAAYSSALIVVQAPEKSGSLITCDYALSMGKDVYVAKEGVGNSYKRKGSSKLFYEGAPVISSLGEIPFDTSRKAFAVANTCKVNECSSFELESSKYGSSKNGPFRFGDRLYVVDIVDK